MDSNRVFNFIYFGFVGDEIGHRRGSGTKIELLAKLLKEHGVTISSGVRVDGDEYRALMSADLMYRFSNKPKIDGEQSSRWPVKYCFLRSIAMNRYTLSAHKIENIQFDFEQLDVFLGYYEELGKNDEIISEMTVFLDNIEKSNNIEKNPNERAAIFIKNCVSLLDVDINRQSVSLCDELKIGDRFLMKSSHYIITAIALKLMSEISKKKTPGESGVKFLYDELFLFYVELMKNDILSKRTEELFDRLQAFIDMFIVGVCYNKQQQAARKEYISGIVKSALNECVSLKVEGVREDVRQFVDEYKNMFFEYVSNNRFKMYAGKKWYNELYHLAEKDKEYFGFITTVMSFLPRKSNDVKRIMSLSKKALEKRVKEKGGGKRIQLNVQVDSDTIIKLEKLEVTFKETRVDIVMQAVKLLYRSRIGPSRSPGPDLGVKPDQIHSIPADEKQDSNARTDEGIKRNSRWNNPYVSSNNEIQDVPPPSASLGSLNENRASVVPLEGSQCHQPPSEQTTSAELPTSNVVENEDKGVHKPNPKSDTSAALQALGDSLH